MTGDASLSITPVMKWNFERSCYRWLVTRHPAQFERMDFTAQILQSASRARKAFYECGWAEAKVLIRPSDGKFERTPFFDTIIRRGLRNSTRFDASTLTEEEVEALGMHRDESLGFKLQIRHFRRRNKDVPQRGGDGSRSPPIPPAEGLRTRIVSHETTPEPLAPTASARPTPCHFRHSGEWRPGTGPDITREQRRWMQETVWRNGNGVDTGSSNNSMVQWTNARQWRQGDGANRTEDREVDLPSNALVPVSSGWRADASRRGHGAWEGQLRKTWGFDQRRPAAWDTCNNDGRKGGERVEYELLPAKNDNNADTRPRRGERGDDIERDDSRSCENDDKGKIAERKSSPPAVVEPRNNFARHMEDRAPRVMGSHSRGNVDGRAGACGSSEAVEPGAGALLAQGYMRLAEMREEGIRAHGNTGGTANSRSRGPLGRVSPSPHGVEVSGLSATLTRASERAVTSTLPNRCLPPITRHAQEGQHPRPGRRSLSPDCEVDPPRKKRRDVEDDDAVKVKADDAVKVGSRSRSRQEPSPGPSRADTTERLNRDRKGAQGALPQPPQSAATSVPDKLARELAEAERQLLSTRQALDAAKVRFEEASRAYNAKREEIMVAAAAGQRNPGSSRHIVQKYGNLQSLARSCVAAAEVRETPKLTVAKVESEPCSSNGGGGNGNRVVSSDSRPDDHDRTGNLSRGGSRERGEKCPSRVVDITTAEIADDITDVKAEAEILCGLGKAQVSGAPGCSPPLASSSPSPSVRTAMGPSDPSKHAAIASLAAVAAAAEAAPPTPPQRHPSPKVKPCTGSPARHPESPLPALARAIPTIATVPENHRVIPAGSTSVGVEMGHQTGCRNASTAREAAGIVAALRVSVRPPVVCLSPSFAPAARTAHVAADEASDRYDANRHVQASHHQDSSSRVFPHMVKTPASPSACGETDSDHSDSTSGAGAGNGIGGAGDGESSYHHHPMHGDHGNGNRNHRYRDSMGAWQCSGGAPRANTYVPPLARLADVAAAGARGGGADGGGISRYEYV